MESKEALRLALKTAERLVYVCGHPRGGCANHCDLLVKVIYACREALDSQPAPSGASDVRTKSIEEMVFASAVEPAAQSEGALLASGMADVSAGRLRSLPEIADEMKYGYTREDMDRAHGFLRGRRMPLNMEENEAIHRDLAIAFAAARATAAPASTPATNVDCGEYDSILTASNVLKEHWSRLHLLDTATKGNEIRKLLRPLFPTVAATERGVRITAEQERQIGCRAILMLMGAEPYLAKGHIVRGEYKWSIVADKLSVSALAAAAQPTDKEAK